MPTAAQAHASTVTPPRTHGVSPQVEEPEVEPPQPDDATTEGDPRASRASELNDLKEKAQVAIDRGAGWIRANPAAAVGLAVAGGFIVGRILRK